MSVSPASAPQQESWSPHIHKDHYSTLMEWAKSKATRSPVAAFLYGPPGVGKTTLAHRIVNDAGFRAVECNASQFRHKAAITDLIEPLLHSTNVGDFFRPDGHRPLGIILDEIDGMSSGDRGGLKELVEILKKYKGPNLIICISNEWQEKRYLPLIRLSLCRQINPPDLESCAIWMGKETAAVQPLWERHHGDLRKLLQWQEGAGVTDELGNDVTQSLSVQDIVMRLLEGELDIQEELQLDNIDMNLVGLHLHETLPGWIREHYDSGAHGWKIYSDCLSSIATSDRQDYYTFFHQHWSLFTLSFQSKLQAVNHRLFVEEQPVRMVATGPRSWKFQYTAVLARQSWLFNQFKYLRELRDTLESFATTKQGHSVPMPIAASFRDGGLEMALWMASLLGILDSNGSHLLPGGIFHTKQKGVTKDRIKYWLQTLSVPVIPPCPVGKRHRAP